MRVKDLPLWLFLSFHLHHNDVLSASSNSKASFADPGIPLLMTPKSGQSSTDNSKIKAIRKEPKADSGMTPDSRLNMAFPEVATYLGQLRGKTLKSRGGKYYYAFLGIPYAETPRRFEMAEEVKPWDEVRDATEFGAACPQYVNTFGLNEDEDCLNLNVYFPPEWRCSKHNLLPVIFYIHYGSYVSGAGQLFGADYWMDECVVVVTVNYRLGALGFLTTEDGVIPGNLGLKDQVVALKWVKKHIRNFRGDPGLVTIMGISAGASCVSHLIASPMAKGLFHRAIAQSGSVLNPWSMARDMNAFVDTMATRLNCTNRSSKALRKCLKSKSTAEIIEAQLNSPYSSVGPVIELNNATNPFHIQNPVELFQSGNFNKVPLLTGITENEGIEVIGGAIVSRTPMLELLNDQWSTLAPLLFLYEQSHLSPHDAEVKQNKISEQIQSFYFGNLKNIGNASRESIINLCSDRFINMGIIRTVELFAQHDVPVFKYAMTYKEGRSNAIYQGYMYPVVTHGDDAKFLFNSDKLLLFDDIPYGSDMMTFSRNLITLWTSFAKTGTPKGNILYASNGWKPWKSGEDGVWFQLDAEAGKLTDYLEDRRKFWQCEVGLETGVNCDCDGIEFTTTGSACFTSANVVYIFASVFTILLYFRA